MFWNPGRDCMYENHWRLRDIGVTSICILTPG
jgi:hypothetical protein